MLKERLKQNKVTVKIDSTLLNSVRDFCDQRGMKIHFFVESAILKKLEEENKGE